MKCSAYDYQVSVAKIISLLANSDSELSTSSVDDIRDELTKVVDDYAATELELETARRELEELKAQQLLTSNKPTCP
jgi:hypothetical protein